MPPKIQLVRREQKSNLKATLMPHQKDFLERALKMERVLGHGGLLGAEMGTGKTLMMLSLLADSLGSGRTVRKTIVVCPLALLRNWMNEYKKHVNLPVSKVCIYHGSSRKRLDLSDKHLIITTYSTVLQDMTSVDPSPLLNYPSERVILDEAHEIKNMNTGRFEACQMLQGNLRWAVTGTPIHNNIKDLYSLAQFMDISPYNDAMWWGNLDDEALNQWKTAVYIYYSKNGLSTQLPNKSETLHKLGFSEEEKLEYDAIRQSKLSILLRILRLRQACMCETKNKKVVELVRQIPKQEKIIIFSQFVSSLEKLATSLAAHGFAENMLLYHGGMTLSDKERTTNLYDSDDSKRILLMSLKAGGVGLNLVRGNHVILLDPWWNVAIENQALSRVHRIGQMREVYVHKLIITETVESWVLGLQNVKQTEAENVLEGKIIEVDIDSTNELGKLFQDSCYV